MSMANRLRVLAFLLLLLPLISVACSPGGSGQPEGITQGNLARDFTLETPEGRPVSLSDYRGQVVLINFWATWCPPCRAEIPGFETVYQANKDKGFMVLGINVEEGAQQVEDFLASTGVSFPILLDENGEVMKEYRALGLPMSVLLTPDGIIHTRHVGFLSDTVLEDYLAQIWADTQSTAESE